MKKNFTEAQLTAAKKVFGSVMNVRFNKSGNINLEPKVADDKNHTHYTLYFTRGRYIPRVVATSNCTWVSKVYPINIKYKKITITYRICGNERHYETKVRDWENSGSDTFEGMLEYMRNYLNKKFNYNI